MAKTDSAVKSVANAGSAKGGVGTNDKTAVKQPKAKTPSKKAAKPNLFERVAGYFRNVAAEMRRVVWPSRQEVYQSSIVVVLTLVFFTTFALLVDQIVIAVVTVLDGIGG